MMNRLLITSLLLAAGLAAMAGEPRNVATNPIQALRQHVQTPAEVMVLATEHLSRIDGLQPRHLDGVHALLLRYAPNQVAVETLASHHIELMLLRPREYEGVLEHFVGKGFLDAAVASQSSLNASPEQARIDLQGCVPLPRADASALGRCMQRAAAAYDKAWFDYMAWIMLRRHPKAEIPTSVATEAQRLSSLVNERQWIAARLADALGLDRVYGVDDQDSNMLSEPVYTALEPALASSRTAAELPTTPLMQVPEKLRASGLSDGNLLPLYRMLNSSEYGEMDLEYEWRLFVDRDLPVAPSLARLALWDTRNLAIAGNMLRIATEHPQERFLLVIGASHKPFLDDYLARSIGVRLRQFDEFIDSGASSDTTP